MMFIIIFTVFYILRITLITSFIKDIDQSYTSIDKNSYFYKGKKVFKCKKDFEDWFIPIWGWGSIFYRKLSKFYDQLDN